MSEVVELLQQQRDERDYYKGWSTKRLIDHILMLNEAYHKVADECQILRIKVSLASRA